MPQINLNLIDIFTFIKTKSKNIFLNKIYVNYSSFRDQQIINTNDINKQTNNICVKKQTRKIVVAGINQNLINTLTFIKTTLKNIFLNK